MTDKPDTTEHEDDVCLQIVCSGIPYCDLRGEDAIKAQEKGCPWCAYIYTEPDGREFIEQPGEA